MEPVRALGAGPEAGSGAGPEAGPGAGSEANLSYISVYLSYISVNQYPRPYQPNSINNSSNKPQTGLMLVPGILPSQYPPTGTTPGTPPATPTGSARLVTWPRVTYGGVNMVMGLRSVAQLTSGPD